MPTCWREAGGEAVTFGSDAHDPTWLARAFVDAAAVVEAHGFDRAVVPMTSGHVWADFAIIARNAGPSKVTA